MTLQALAQIDLARAWHDHCATADQRVHAALGGAAANGALSGVPWAALIPLVGLALATLWGIIVQGRKQWVLMERDLADDAARRKAQPQPIIPPRGLVPDSRPSG